MLVSTVSTIIFIDEELPANFIHSIHYHKFLPFWLTFLRYEFASVLHKGRHYKFPLKEPIILAACDPPTPNDQRFQSRPNPYLDRRNSGLHQGFTSAYLSRLLYM